MIAKLKQDGVMSIVEGKLIARCVSVGSLMYNHVSWEHDSMVIVFPSHKCDQEGRNALPKLIYANIAEPHICPILSFSVYISITEQFPISAGKIRNLSPLKKLLSS
jgi:hypothetical protein